jgi:hypothetical protein
MMERATDLESAKRSERAIRQENTIQTERAIGSESATKRERARIDESAMSLDRAKRDESFNVPERATLGESANNQEQSNMDQFTPTNAEIAKCCEREVKQRQWVYASLVEKGRLRAYGNAICAPLAAEFIAAVMECQP